MEAWYAIRVRSNVEKQVQASLAGKGFETFLPLCRTASRWSDRLKKIETPLFSGYVFGRFDAVRRLPVLSTPGVVHIVGNSTGPLAVDEAELHAVRKLVETGRRILPWPWLEPGDLVVVERGPLAGARGTLLRVKDEYRLVVSISLLQRSVAVELERDAVRRDGGAPAHRSPQPARAAAGF